MADEENEEIAKPRSKNRVLVAMNYILVLAIIIGIGAVLFKDKPAANSPGITGSAAVDSWCETHTAKADCENECQGKSFDEYASCTGDCFQRLDACKR